MVQLSLRVLWGKQYIMGLIPPPPLPYKVLSREKAVSECLPVVSSTASVSMSLVFKRANEGLQGPDCVTKSRELPSLSSEPQQVVLVGLWEAITHTHVPAAQPQTSYKCSCAATLWREAIMWMPADFLAFSLNPCSLHLHHVGTVNPFLNY